MLNWLLVLLMPVSGGRWHEAGLYQDHNPHQLRRNDVSVAVCSAVGDGVEFFLLTVLDIGFGGPESSLLALWGIVVATRTEAFVSKGSFLQEGSPAIP